ncbi:hypothetical protein CH063_06827 [Colletotrichum higginsianum]|uniref:Uncharacterized protein n=1 Tax=Colletotrichum higginsianum (strain IMI 349063) TaxID=759273 RepID=H1V3X0_COLHI|nr:hypothetical protein CH063_06827 [Colletotrichum higginsianum]
MSCPTIVHPIPCRLNYGGCCGQCPRMSVIGHCNDRQCDLPQINSLMEAASHHQRHILDGQFLSSLPSKACRQVAHLPNRHWPVNRHAHCSFIYASRRGGPLSTYGTSQRPPPLFQPRPIGCSSSGEIMWEIATAALQMTVICRWHMSIAHLTDTNAAVRADLCRVSLVD